jgi:hypothetical protein
VSVAVFQEVKHSIYGCSCNEENGMKFMLDWRERAPETVARDKLSPE